MIEEIKVYYEEICFLMDICVVLIFELLVGFIDKDNEFIFGI